MFGNGYPNHYHTKTYTPPSCGPSSSRSTYPSPSPDLRVRNRMGGDPNNLSLWGHRFTTARKNPFVNALPGPAILVLRNIHKIPHPHPLYNRGPQSSLRGPVINSTKLLDNSNVGNHPARTPWQSPWRPPHLLRHSSVCLPTDEAHSDPLCETFGSHENNFGARNIHPTH